MSHLFPVFPVWYMQQMCLLFMEMEKDFLLFLSLNNIYYLSLCFQPCFIYHVLTMYLFLLMWTSWPQIMTCHWSEIKKKLHEIAPQNRACLISKCVSSNSWYRVKTLYTWYYFVYETPALCDKALRESLNTDCKYWVVYSRTKKNILAQVSRMEI